jgi:hypothetical protein
MKLRTQLSKGPPYKLEFKLEISESERALIVHADAWTHILYASEIEVLPHITVKRLLTGSSFEAEKLTSIQLVEAYVNGAAQQFRKLLDTLDGLGEPQFKEF